MSVEKYKDFFDQHTYGGQDPIPFYGRKPKSRYMSVKYVLDHFRRTNGKVIAELGTIRSFVHGGLAGCNSNDSRYWTPNNPENWDWGAGCFSRVAVEELKDMDVSFHTVDIAQDHINRCKVITSEYSDRILYHVCSSQDFLRSYQGKLDLIYLDTGDMTPIEPTANLQLEEAQIIVEKDLLASNGLILVDDVRNTTPIRAGETSLLGKAKYSIPYLLQKGFKILIDEYQIVLGRE